MTRLLTRLGGFAALATLVAATALPASAQRMRTERVRFSPGTSEATMASAARRGRSVRYLVGASAGQTLAASASNTSGPADCTVRVFAPGRPAQDRYAAPSEGGYRGAISDWSGRLSRAGDYQVVLSNTATSGTCRVHISVQ